MRRTVLVFSLTILLQACIAQDRSPSPGGDGASWIDLGESVSPTTHCFILPDGTHEVLTLHEDGTALSWDLNTGKLRSERRLGERGAIAAALSPDGRRLATFDGRLRITDLAGTRAKRTLPGLPTAELRALAFSPDDRWLGFGDAKGAVGIWNLNEESSTASGAGPPVLRVAFSPDSARLAAVNAAARCRLLSPQGGINAWDASDRPLVAVAFSRDLARFVAVDEDGGIRISDFVPDAIPRTVTGGKDFRILELSPNGRWIAGGRIDGSVLLWELAASSAPVVLARDAGAVTSLSFSSDGSVLAAGAALGSARCWLPWKTSGVEDGSDPADAWSRLASEETRVAFDAQRRLIRAGSAGVNHLRAHAFDLSSEGPRIRDLVRELDSPRPDARERAEAELFATDFEAELARFKPGEASPEVASRLARLSTKADGPVPGHPNRIRAVEVLERIGTADAVALLRDWERSSPLGRVRREAAVSLRLLRKV